MRASAVRELVSQEGEVDLISGSTTLREYMQLKIDSGVREVSVSGAETAGVGCYERVDVEEGSLGLSQRECIIGTIEAPFEFTDRDDLGQGLRSSCNSSTTNK